MLIRSEVATAYRAGDERAGRLIQPVMFLRRGQPVSERDLPAVGLGEKVVAGATGVGLDVIAAGAAIE